MNLTNQYPSLKGKVVLISGGASGIGANLVDAFCRQGATVAFIDILDDAAEWLVGHIGALNGVDLPHYYKCDMVDIPALQRTIAQIQQDLGPINVLINNAANDERHDFRDVTVDYWDERMAVNLRHHFFASQAVYADMQKLGGGSIINLGSMSWYATQGGMPAYTSAKAAIEGLTRGLARDMGPDNIRVNTLVLWLGNDQASITNLCRRCRAAHYSRSAMFKIDGNARRYRRNGAISCLRRQQNVYIAAFYC